jgi:glutamate dehydrogenase (NADP+)
MKKLANNSACVFTGKGLAFGGSLIRPEATGYGLVYFVEDMLASRATSLEGLRISVSGSGNVAQYAIEKALAHGARVVTVSDSGGTVIDEAGFDADKLAALMRLKNERYGRVEEFARERSLRYVPGASPWDVAVDVALPCATQNELTADDARRLVANGVKCVAEGANMPCTLGAVEVFREARVLYAPGKASNAGGVATSGLEMTQNAQRLPWEREEVDQRLRMIMHDIHENCVAYGRGADGDVDYVDGANIAGFVKVADAMIAQGLY